MNESGCGEASAPPRVAGAMSPKRGPRGSVPVPSLFAFGLALKRTNGTSPQPEAMCRPRPQSPEWLIGGVGQGSPVLALKRGCRERAHDMRCASRQIFRTRAESQRIVATGPLCRVQYPVPYSSRLQGIHRAGSGNCDGSRLVRYGCAWLPPRGGPLSFRHGF